MLTLVVHGQTNVKQDAQLSRRNRAAGCVIGLAKSGRLELGDKMQNKGHYGARSGLPISVN